MLGNIHNWTAMARIFETFEQPLRVLRAIATGRALDEVVLSTPTGKVRLAMRNFESLKTCFSVFCRRDYPIAGKSPHLFLDVGANVGVAGTFFLSRNGNNRVICFEPDANNLTFLRRNMEQFGDRVRIVPKAVGVAAGTATLHRSEDGKYSSLMETDVAVDTEIVEVLPFGDILREAASQDRDTVLKIDIEGLETALVESVDFADYPRISRIIVESLECSERIARLHERRVRNGYVEDLAFA